MLKTKGGEREGEGRASQPRCVRKGNGCQMIWVRAQRFLELPLASEDTDLLLQVVKLLNVGAHFTTELEVANGRLCHILDNTLLDRSKLGVCCECVSVEVKIKKSKREKLKMQKYLRDSFEIDS